MADKTVSKRFQAALNASQSVEFGDVFKVLGDHAGKATATTVVTEVMESAIAVRQGKIWKSRGGKQRAISYRARNAYLRSVANEIRAQNPNLTHKTDIARAMSKEIKARLRKAALSDEERRNLEKIDLKPERLRKII